MTPRRLLLIAVNAALLAGVIAMATADLGQGASEANAKSGPMAVSIPAAPQQTAPRASSGRPLFKSRSAEPEPQMQDVAPAPLLDPTFRLAGVVWSDDQRLAVVQRLDDGGHRRLKLADALDGWRLVELTSRTARFSSGERSITMRLSAPSDLAPR